MKNCKIAPSCDSYLYAIYSMNYLLCIYFIINTKQSLVYEKLKIVPSWDSYLYEIYSNNFSSKPSSAKLLQRHFFSETSSAKLLQ